VPVAPTSDSPTGETSRRSIRITIADTGHGMSAEIMARIFEPFYTTKEINGLSLWISSEIVNRHGGRLSARSSQDPAHRGTVFTLFLPLDTTTGPEHFPHTSMTQPADARVRLSMKKAGQEAVRGSPCDKRQTLPIICSCWPKRALPFTSYLVHSSCSLAWTPSIDYPRPASFPDRNKPT
jgi:hypothetical protein